MGWGYILGPALPAGWADSRCAVLNFKQTSLPAASRTFQSARQEEGGRCDASLRRSAESGKHEAPLRNPARSKGEAEA